MQALPPNFVQRSAYRTSCIATVRTSAHHQPGTYFGGYSTNTLLRDGAKKKCHNFSSTFARGDLQQHWIQRLHRRRRVQLWPCMCLIFLHDPPRAQAGLPCLSLVSLPKLCLDVCLRPLVYILWRRMLSTSSRLALAHSSGSSHPPLLSSPMPPFPQAEQLGLIVVQEFLHFIWHVTCVFWNNPAHPSLHPLLFCSRVFTSCLSSFNCSSIAWAT